MDDANNKSAAKNLKISKIEHLSTCDLEAYAIPLPLL